MPFLSSELACSTDIIDSLIFCSLRQPQESACEATGNRRLVHCITMPLYTSLGHGQFLRESVEGELATWEPCGKLVSAEGADYWEFVVRLVASYPIACS